MKNFSLFSLLSLVVPYLLFAEADETSVSKITELNSLSASCDEKCEPKEPPVPPPQPPACCEIKLPKPPPCPSTRCRPQCKYERWMFQVRGAAFISFDHEFREVYGTAAPTMEVEGSYRVWKSLTCPQDRLLVFANIGWTTKTGKSIGFGYYSQLNLIPFSVGIEYQVNLMDSLGFYIGIGPSYSLLRVKNYDGFVTNHHNRQQFGFTTKTGLRWTFAKYFFADAFGDYSFTPFRNIHDPIQNLKGTFNAFNLGAGLGVTF